MADSPSDDVALLAVRGALLDSLPAVPSRDPVTVYLSRLATTSRRSQYAALRTVAAILAPVPEGTAPPSPESIPWHALTYAHQQALRAKVAVAYDSPATANRILAAVRGVVRECANLGLMSHETKAAILSVPGVRGSRLTRGRALTVDEVRALIATTAQTTLGVRDRALIAVLFGGGLRRCEVATLATYHVEPKGVDGARIALRVAGKGNKQRRVPLPPDATEAVMAWVKARGPESGPLFVSFTKHGGMRRRMGTGEPGELRDLTASGIYEILAGLAVRAGVPPFSPHDARRTRITNLFAAGQPITAIQKLHGHANPSTTAKYDRSSEETMERTAGAVGVL